MKYHKLLFTISSILLTIGAAQASPINLASYSVSATYSLDVLDGVGGPISGLEASAVTYAADRHSLFFVGDEGTGVIETSLTGKTLGKMKFDWAGTGSTKHDTEGLTYVGNGQLVLSEERLQDAYKFDFVNNGTAKLANNFVSMANNKVKNHGIEGISYDPRDGSFVTVKQDSPELVNEGKLTFAPATGGLPDKLPKHGKSPNGGGESTMKSLFDPSSLGLSTLSDIQTLGILDSDDLLILSLGSKKLVSADRSGKVLSTFDLSSVVAGNNIEGVTIDEKGTIYLVAEGINDGEGPSKLVVLSSNISSVPVPSAVLLFAPALIGFMALRRKQKTVNS